MNIHVLGKTHAISNLNERHFQCSAWCHRQAEQFLGRMNLPRPTTLWLTLVRTLSWLHRPAVLFLGPRQHQAQVYNDAIVERFVADTELAALMQATAKVSDLIGAQYDAIFFPGGHGTMWDLPTDAGVTKAVEAAFEAKKFIASVCHGAGGLVSAKRPDGQSIGKDLRINAFMDAEEIEVGLDSVVPFMLEARLSELRCHFEGATN
jgi:hypothetical protein